MTSILDHFVPTIAPFHPKTTGELFALRLAQKLNDAAAVRHYVQLADEYSETELLSAFRRAVHSGTGPDLGRRFHVELRHSNNNGGNGRHSQLAAIRVERRAVAVAIFAGDQLSYTQVRQLSSAKDKALASAVGFINWIGDQFRLDSATVESIPLGDEVQRQMLSHAVVDALRGRALPIWELSKKDLFEAFAYPRLRSRKQLRHIVADIWPVLAGSNGKGFVQDAAAMGLHVLIERSFL